MEASAESHTPLAALAAELGHHFADPNLLGLALTHRSHAYTAGRLAQGRAQGVVAGPHNERLEFLGDAVLGLVAAEWLFNELPGRQEGELAKLKGYLVSEGVLAEHAKRLDLGKFLLLATAEERTGGRHKASVLADALEAVFAALWLDGGLDAARRAIRPMLDAHRETFDQLLVSDAKTDLQELAQARGWPLPVYRVAAEDGPAHQPQFTVECWLAAEVAGVGIDRSKKRAEQRAAAEALRLLAPERAGR